MEEYLHRVKKSPLFYGINDNELYTLLKCCAAEQVPYEDGEYIFRMGESVNKVLILLKGRARVIQENCWGRQAPVAEPGVISYNMGVKTVKTEGLA